MIRVQTAVPLVFAHGVGEATLAVLRCYMDESSDKGGKKIFAVGAVIGNDVKWGWLLNEWKSVLSREGLAYFRSNDSAAMTGEFLKFRKNKHEVSDVERRKGRGIRNELLERIADSRVTGIGIAVDMVAFRAVANNAKKLDAFGGTPYYHCYFMAIAQCAQIIKEHRPGDALEFGYDQHHQHGPYLQSIYDDFKRKNADIAPQMTTIQSLDDKTFVAVQVADLVASIVRKFALWKIAKPRPSRPYELKVLERTSVIGIIRVCGITNLNGFLRDRGLN